MAVPSPSKTLYEKLFDNHTITTREDGSTLIYIDRHLIHEMTSPQAFEGLRVNERLVRRPDLTLATADHNVPTTTRKGITDIEGSIADEESRIQCRALRDNAVENGIKFYGLDHRLQGIVHVIGPELGFTLPGMTIVCGDSHTSTHGAFGSLAFGIGTTEVEHVLATQTLVMSKSKTMRINITGKLRPFVTSKDLMLYIIGTIGTAGGTGKVIEYAGETIEGLSMEARMSLCNMSIEAGARAGLVAPDATTIEYLRGRPLLAQWNEQTWKDMESYWMSLRTDVAAVYDFNVDIRAEDVAPMVTWGTSPEQVVPISSAVPDPATQQDPAKAESWTRALKYIGLEAGQRMEDVKIDKVFIGSCTNSRLEDLRQAAEVAKGNRVSPHIKTALVVPGSGSVKVAAEAEGLDKVFTDAGFEWREAGCSMCCGVNDDKLMVKERSASTSNRNFENRQGTGSRTHLCSPAMAAAAAIHGHLADVRNMKIITTSESRPTSPPITISMDGGDDETLQQTHAKSELDFTSGRKQPHDETNNGQPRRGLAPRKQRLNRDTAQQTPPPSSSSSSSSSHPRERGLRQLRGRVTPLDRSNVDTDCIMPTRYCKTVRRSGLGKGLFYNLRRLADGSGNLDPSFPLNQQRFAGSSILLSLGPNFGCGSSREHAVWALLDYGFRCVIAPSFADIFYNNSFKAGLLPIALPSAAISKLAALAEAGVEIEVDVVASKIVDADGSEIASFDMDPHRKEAMVKGLDDIGLTLEKLQKIISYEEQRYKQFPWVDGAPPSLLRQAVVA